MKIDIVAGARPNFVKIAPIIRELGRRMAEGGPLRWRLVHTGQHYDAMMSGSFFEQLRIPSPDVNLEIGSGSQAEQVAAIMVGYERLLKAEPVGCCLVVGDVNSTIACALAAKKERIPVAHVEAGIRSGDWTMPEEVNRVATDSITNWYFTTSEFANQNLRSCGVGNERIFFVGNTMIDSLVDGLERLSPPDVVEASCLSSGKYIVATLHRPANVDDVGKLGELVLAIGEAAQGMPVVFPVHPRTRKVLAQIERIPGNMILVDALPYLQFNWLVKNCLAVVTDSGGITEEATYLGVPCMTLRDNTERPETVEVGTNVLVGTDPRALRPHFETLLAGGWKVGRIPELWDGRASVRIVQHLEKLLC